MRRKQSESWKPNPHHVHAVTSLSPSAWLKSPTSLHDVAQFHWSVSSRRDSSQHTNKQNQSLSLLFLSLSFSLSLSLSLSLHLCFSLCKIPPISPLPYLFCSSNSHIRTQQCTIFRTNAILIFDFLLCPFHRRIGNARGNGKLSQWWVLPFAELRRQQWRRVIGAATSYQSGGNRK